MTDEWSGSDATRTGRKAGKGEPEGMDFPWRWENLNITPAVVGEAKKRLDAGASLEETLRYLRDSGANAIDSIVFLRAFFGMSIKQAQETLHASETWSELRGR